MITLGEGMKLAGYRTALSGKWHLMKTRRRSKEKAAGDWIDRFDKTTHPFHAGRLVFPWRGTLHPQPHPAIFEHVDVDSLKLSGFV